MYRFLLFVVLISFACGKDKVEKTDCQEHRDREANSRAPLPLRLIPECDENGDYKSRQCFKDSEFCICMDKTGQHLTQASKKYKACDCIIKKKAIEDRGLLGAVLPQCEEDGTYRKKQCHASTGHCWCVEKSTGEKISDPTREQIKC